MKSIRNIITKNFSTVSYKKLDFTYKYLTLFNTPSDWNTEFVSSKFNNVGNLISVNEFSDQPFLFEIDQNQEKLKNKNNQILESASNTIDKNIFRLNFNGIDEKNCVQLLENMMKTYNFNVEFAKTISNDFKCDNIVLLISKENKSLKESSILRSFLLKSNINSYRINFSQNFTQAFIQINEVFNIKDLKSICEKDKIYICEGNHNKSQSININDTNVNDEDFYKRMDKNHKLLINHLLLKKKESKFYINLLIENSKILYNNAIIHERLNSKKKIFNVHNNAVMISN